MASRQLVYSNRRVDSGGRAVKNPRHFTGPVKGATKVFIDGDWPKVRSAYEKANVPVADIADMRPLAVRKADTAEADTE